MRPAIKATPAPTIGSTVLIPGLVGGLRATEILDQIAPGQPGQEVLAVVDRQFFIDGEWTDTIPMSRLMPTEEEDAIHKYVGPEIDRIDDFNNVDLFY